MAGWGPISAPEADTTFIRLADRVRWRAAMGMLAATRTEWERVRENLSK